MTGVKITRIKNFIIGFGRNLLRSGSGQVVIKLLAAASSMLLFLWLANETPESGAAFYDETIRQTIHRWEAPWLTPLMFFASRIGSGIFLTAETFLAAIIFLLFKRNRAAVILLLTMIGELVLEHTLKLYFQRTRPKPFFDYPPLETYSFPSGHALGSFSLFIMLAWLITSGIKDRGLKIAVWIFAAALIFLIGFSRIYLGVHYPSDVLAGLLVASVWILTISLTVYLLRNRNSKNI